MDAYISPNIRLINLISISRSQPIEDSHPMSCLYLDRAEPGPNSKINCLYSHCQIFGPSLVFPSSLILHFSLPTFTPQHLRFEHAGYLFVTDILSTPTIIEPPAVKCQDISIPTRLNTCVARINLGHIIN